MIKKVQDRLKDLKDGADRLPKSMELGSTAIQWERLKDDPVLSDKEKVKKCFDREEAGQQYKKAVDDPKKAYGLRDAQVAKLQSDLLASLQQGFVMRHRSRMQMLADAASFRRSVQEARVDLIFERTIANIESAK